MFDKNLMKLKKKIQKTNNLYHLYYNFILIFSRGEITLIKFLILKI